MTGPSSFSMTALARGAMTRGAAVPAPAWGVISTVNVSSNSAAASAATLTVTVRKVSPLARVSVLPGSAPPAKSAALATLGPEPTTW